MHGRNGSLLAFRVARPSNGRDADRSTPDGHRDSTLPAPGPPQPATVVRARVDCPRCRLPLSVEGLQWTAPRHSDGSGSSEEVERRLLEERYAEIRDGERDYRTVIHDLERRLLREALDRNEGVMKEAARSLGMKYTTFVAKAHRLGLAPSDA